MIPVAALSRDVCRVNYTRMRLPWRLELLISQPAMIFFVSVVRQYPLVEVVVRGSFFLHNVQCTRSWFIYLHAMRCVTV